MSVSTVLAQVSSVRSANVSYPCCKQCNSKLYKENHNYMYGSWSCKKCGSTYAADSVSYKYRVCFTVNDGLTRCEVTVFGAHLDPFFGLTATQFQRFLEDIEKKVLPGIQLDVILEDALYQIFVGNYFYFGFKTKKFPLTNSGKTFAPIPLSIIFENAKDRQHNFEGMQDCGLSSELPGLIACRMQAAKGTMLSESVSHYLRYLVFGMNASTNETTIDTSNTNMSSNLSGLLLNSSELYKNEIHRGNAHSLGLVPFLFSDSGDLLMSQYAEDHCSTLVRSGGERVKSYCDTTLVSASDEEEHIWVKNRQESSPQISSGLLLSHISEVEIPRDIESGVDMHVGMVDLEPCGEDSRDSCRSTTFHSVDSSLSGDWFQIPNLAHVSTTRGGSIMDSPSIDKTQNGDKLETTFDLLNISAGAESSISGIDYLNSLEVKCSVESSLSEMLPENGLKQNLIPNGMYPRKKKGAILASTLLSDGSYSAHLSQLFQQMMDSSSAVQRNSKANLATCHKQSLDCATPTTTIGGVVSKLTTACDQLIIDSDNSLTARDAALDSDRNSEDLFGSQGENGSPQRFQQSKKLYPPTPGVKVLAFDQAVFDVTSSGEVSITKSLEKTEIYLDHYKNAAKNYTLSSEGISDLLTQSRIEDFSITPSPSQGDELLRADHLLSTPTISFATSPYKVGPTCIGPLINSIHHDVEICLMSDKNINHYSYPNIDIKPSSVSELPSEESTQPKELDVFKDNVSIPAYNTQDLLESDLPIISTITETAHPASDSDTAVNTINDSDIAAHPASDPDTAVNTINDSDTAAHPASDPDTAVNTINDSDAAAHPASDSDTAVQTRNDSDTAAHPASDSDTAVQTRNDSDTAAHPASDSDTAVNTINDSDTAAYPASDPDTAVKTIIDSDTAVLTTSSVDDTKQTKDQVICSPHHQGIHGLVSDLLQPVVFFQQLATLQDGPCALHCEAKVLAVSDTLDEDLEAGSFDLFEESQDLFDCEAELSLDATSHPPTCHMLLAAGRRSVHFSSKNELERVNIIDIKMKSSPMPSSGRKPKQSCLRKSTTIASALKVLGKDRPANRNQQEYNVYYNNEDFISGSQDLFNDDCFSDGEDRVQSSTPNFKTIRCLPEISTPILAVEITEKTKLQSRLPLSELTDIGNRSSSQQESSVNSVHSQDFFGNSLLSPVFIAGTPETRSLHFNKPNFFPRGQLVFGPRKTPSFNYQIPSSVIDSQSSLQNSQNLFSFLDGSNDYDSNLCEY